MDDSAIRPTAPQLDYTVEEQVEIASREDKQTAEAYFHPAWAKVEDMFVEAINKYSTKPDKSLTAEEYKIKGIADEQTANELKVILQRVGDAVSAVETDRRESGTKGE